MSADLRSCHIHVYEDWCSVQMRAHGETVLTREGLTLADAFELADALKLAHKATPKAPAPARPMATVHAFQARDAA